MTDPLQQIRAIVDIKSREIRELALNKDSYAETKNKYKQLIDKCVREISAIIIKESNDAGYNPVITFNSIILGQKIIITDNHFLEISAYENYDNWQPNEDEQTTLHWGKCVPHGRKADILFRQLTCEEYQKKFDRVISKKGTTYECRIPDFSTVKKEQSKEDRNKTVEEIIKCYGTFMQVFKEDVNSIWDYKELREVADSQIITSLFNPAIVMGWKSGFASSHDNFNADFISNKQFLSSFYLFKQEIIDFDAEREKLVEINSFYNEAVKAMSSMGQSFLITYLGIDNLHLNVWNTIENKIKNGTFDRYRVLGSSNEKKQEDEKTKYKSELNETLMELHKEIDTYLRRRGMWMIVNYSSLFLDERLNVLRTPGESNPSIKITKTNELSWYGILGSINRNTVLKIEKNDTMANISNPIETKEIESIFEQMTVIYYPEGDGTDRSKYTYNIGRKLVTDLTENNTITIDGTLRPYLYNSAGCKLLKDNEAQIAETLFSSNNLSQWEKDCLIFSNKYNLEFADSVEYFPNFLFFKETGSFSEDEIVLCHIINSLCVEISTELLVFENEILLDRIEDLVDSKPKRIFDLLNKEVIKMTTDKSVYIDEVEKVFKSFIREHFIKAHPLIRNNLVIAYYLYWTKYFTDERSGDYLSIPAWCDDKNIKQFKCWGDYSKEKNEEIKNRDKNEHFDFKGIIYELTGEKMQVEFEMLNCKDLEDKFKNGYGEISDDDRGEFNTIVVGNIDALTESTRYIYNNYLENELNFLINEMDVTKEEKNEKKIKQKIENGKPAEYFSLFCADALMKMGCKYVYFIPSVNYDGTSSGGFSFFCKNKWPRSITKAAQTWATRFGATFSKIEAEKLVKRETDKHGTKSAIISIDVRNLSHNIGSHVLAYWTQELSQLLQEYKGENDKLQKAIYKSNALFRYIQHRADFLAEVATSIPCSEMTFNLKTDILNPFLYGKSDTDNHYIADNGTIPADGLSMDSNVYILLRYIAESEGISINFEALDNGITRSSALKKVIKKVIQYEDSKQRIWISIPSGVIGKHAIYSILENFIRNAAKHYKGSDSANGDFIKIKVEDYDDNYIMVDITDIRKDSCKLEDVIKLQGFIRGSFVDEHGSLKSGGWGIKEMLVSANFLRKNAPEDLYDIITERETCEPPLLEIVCSNNTALAEGNRKNDACEKCSKNLGIRFYLKKPKHLAVMTDIIKDEQIKKNGDDFFEIKKITAAEFKDKPIPYNILLVDGKTYKENYKDKDDPLAPCRVMVYDGSSGKGKEKTIGANCYLCLYKKFIEDEIWGKATELPKIFNNLSGLYNFVKTDLSLATYNSPLGNIISFYSHPEKPDNRIGANKHFIECCFFQPISGGFSTKAKFFNTRDLKEPIRYHFYLELIEAALIKVVIVDERISEWADKQSKYKLCECVAVAPCTCPSKTVREMLKQMKVYVAEINKENITCDGLAEKLPSETLGCEVFDSADNSKAHFFVIHQGILDKLSKENVNNNFMKRIKCRWKVIDSGRGVPENMKCRFVQISALQTLLENYDKHGLVQTLFSLRRPQVKEGQSGNQD